MKFEFSHSIFVQEAVVKRQFLAQFKNTPDNLRRICGVFAAHLFELGTLVVYH